MLDKGKKLPDRVSILGAARSGLAAAAFFKERNASVFISDSCPEDKLVQLLESKNLTGIPFESRGHSERVLECDAIILSPGIPSDIPVLLEARNRKIPVWSEMELGFRASDATFLAVTGSTGKSTTVSLLGSAIEATGKEVVVSGNIGLPVISVSPDMKDDAIVVVEVSSFQLENIDTFNPKGAAVINLMKNHLDRYRCEEDYYDAKKNIARNFTKDNFLVLNSNDSRLNSWAREMKNKTNVVFFGTSRVDGDCFWYENGLIQYSFGGIDGTILDVKNMKIGGVHNYENACVAAALAKIGGISDDVSIANGICSFGGLQHRLEYVAEKDGIRFFNDSKSTTAESILSAITAFDKNVFLIAGGKDKGCDFSVVNEAIRNNVKGICLIGEAAQRMEKQWMGLSDIKRAQSLEEAVEMVSRLAMRGDVIVFSPGCSSFDMFKNYEERGDVFKEIVLKRVEGIVE